MFFFFLIFGIPVIWWTIYIRCSNETAWRNTRKNLNNKKGAKRWVLLTRVSQFKAVINIVLCVSSQWKVEFDIPSLCCRVKEPLVSLASLKRTHWLSPHIVLHSSQAGGGRPTPLTFPVTAVADVQGLGFIIKEQKWIISLTLWPFWGDGPAEWVFAKSAFLIMKPCVTSQVKRLVGAPSKPCGGSGTCLLQI